MALIFDTETTGLPAAFGSDYKNIKAYDNCRLVHVCVLLTDELLERKKLHDVIIRREGFSIDNSSFHGITNELSDEKGVAFEDFAVLFSEALDECTIVISHNTQFDINVVASEFYRREMYDIVGKLSQKRIWCSMKKTTNILKLGNPLKPKYPKLAELFKYATGEELQNAHNATADTVNLHTAIVALVRRKLLILPM